MLLDDLATPALLVERRRLHANLDAMQAVADGAGVALRPHVKTHKSVEIARLQLDRGARGLTAAKPSEAAVFAAASAGGDGRAGGHGLADLFIAYPVAGHARLADTLALAARIDAAGGRLAVGADTARGADHLSAVVANAGRRLDVRLEIDTGHGRTGVVWDDLPGIVALARHIAALPGLRLSGLFTHEGHAYAGPAEGETPTEGRRRVMREAQTRLLAAADAVGEAGLASTSDFAISMGSTPTATVFEPLVSPGGRRVTELRPGNYVFHDAQQVALGASLDACALTALATVVSRKRRGLGQERVFLDAGRKVLTGDLGYGRHEYGLPLYNARTMREHPHLRLDGLSEEHLWVDVRGHATLDVGDRVRLVPNHACVAVATQDRLVLVDGDEVAGEIAVDARAAVR